MSKVMIGMSGGVDSSVASTLLKDAGYEVIGATLKLFSNEDIDEKESRCCSLSDVEDARRVAQKLGFDHFVFNFSEDFKSCVMDKFVCEYERGRTPNPCIDCNKYIKFEKMLTRAMQLECDYIATGHYAQIERDEKSGRFLLKKAADSSKDQSYVLYNLTQYQLSHLLLPLGSLLKSEVRQIAEKKGLVNAKKPDSQDICFVPDGDYAQFIKYRTKKDFPHGPFVDKDGNTLGEHKGIICYTIGQRKGLGIALGHPAFVVSKDVKTNTVVLGENKDLFSKTLLCDDVNWISIENLAEPMRVSVKTRYKQKEVPATIYPEDGGIVRAEFDEPQRAISPGQAAVFYDGNIVVGGGTIIE